MKLENSANTIHLYCPFYIANVMYVHVRVVFTPRNKTTGFC